MQTLIYAKIEHSFPLRQIGPASVVIWRAHAQFANDEKFTLGETIFVARVQVPAAASILQILHPLKIERDHVKVLAIAKKDAEALWEVHVVGASADAAVYHCAHTPSADASVYRVRSANIDHFMLRHLLSWNKHIASCDTPFIELNEAIVAGYGRDKPEMWPEFATAFAARTLSSPIWRAFLRNKQRCPVDYVGVWQPEFPTQIEVIRDKNLVIDAAAPPRYAVSESVEEMKLLPTARHLQLEAFYERWKSLFRPHSVRYEMRDGEEYLVGCSTVQTWQIHSWQILNPPANFPCDEELEAHVRFEEFWMAFNCSSIGIDTQIHMIDQKVAIKKWVAGKVFCASQETYRGGYPYIAFSGVPHPEKRIYRWM